MNCKNCDQVASGNFCNNCGQSTKIGKITLSNLLSELSESVFQVNRGFFYTVKELFINPGASILLYLKGKRKKHFKPLAYVLTLSTIYFLISRLLGSETFLNDAVTGFMLGSNGSEIEADQVAMLNMFANNYAYTVLLLLPLYSLASYLSFKVSGYNYLEHFVLNAYITGQQAIIYLSFSFLSLVFGNSEFWAPITLCLSMLYSIFVFWQFFQELSRFQVILRSILTYIIYLILLIAALLLLLLVVQYRFEN